MIKVHRVADGPYFTVGKRVLRHWPSYPVISKAEIRFGPDFVDQFDSGAEAEETAADLNRRWASLWKERLPEN